MSLVSHEVVSIIRAQMELERESYHTSWHDTIVTSRPYASPQTRLYKVVGQLVCCEQGNAWSSAEAGPTRDGKQGVVVGLWSRPSRTGNGSVEWMGARELVVPSFRFHRFAKGAIA